MKWLTKLFFALLLLSGAAFSQSYTAVSGVAKDSQGNLYINCSFSVNFVGQSSLPGPYLLNGSVFQQNYSGRCDGFGLFSITLPSNVAIQPQPSQWQFLFCDTSGHFCNAQNTALITIAGSTQDITAQLTAVLPVLPAAAGVSSFNGRSGAVMPAAGDYAAFYAPVGGAIPQAPGNTIFGNNTVATANASFFTPGGDVSFSSGNFSVNQLHFGPNPLALTNVGIATGNCLQVSGTSIIGGTCGAGNLAGSGTVNFVPKFTATSAIGNSLLSDNASTLNYTGTGGVVSGKFSSPSGPFQLTSTTGVLPATTPGASINGLVSGPDGWYVSQNNAAYVKLNTGGVTSFNTRTGAVVPAANDYNFNQLAGTVSSTQIGTAAVTAFNSRSGAVTPSAGDYSVAQISGAAPITSPAFQGVPTAITATQGTNSNQLATTAFVLANSGGTGSQNPPASQSAFTPTCATANTGGNLTITGTIIANDTVFVGISAYNTPVATFTVTDTGNSNYSQLIADSTLASHLSTLFVSTVNGALASTSLTVRTTATTKYIACAAAYKNVGSLGAPAPTIISTASTTGSVSVTTTQSNTIVFGFIGGTAAVTPTAGTGTFLFGLATSVSNGANGAMCSNQSSTIGTVSCTVTFPSNSTSSNFAVELHNVLGVTSVFGRTGAVAAASGDYNFSQITGTVSTAQLGNNAVTSFNSRAGAVLPATGDYNFNQIAGTITTSQIGTAAVTSWNGQTGAVVPNTGDYTVAQVTGAAPLASPHFTGVPTSPTPAATSADTTVATTAYVTNAVSTVVPPVGPSNFQPTCVAASTGGTISFNGTITQGDTVLVGISVANNSPPAFTVNDNGTGTGSTYNQLATASTAPQHTALLFATPVNTAVAATAITVHWTGTSKYEACAMAFENVSALGTPSPTSNATASTTAGATVATTSNNSLVFGFLGGNAALNVLPMTQLTGTLLASGATTTGNGASAAICQNTANVPGTVGCSVTLSANASHDSFAIELRSNPGAPPPAAPAAVTSFNSRAGAVTPATNDYTVGQIAGAAPLASPALTGAPTSTTPPVSDNSTNIATTAWVQTTLAGTPGSTTSIPITHSAQVPTCSFKNTGNTLTIPVSIAAGDSFFLAIMQNTRNPATGFSFTDNGSPSSNTYTELVSSTVSTTTYTAYLFATPAGQANPATSLTINSSVNAYTVCVMGYAGVASYGTPVSSGSSTTGTTASIGTTTTSANSFFLGFIAFTVNATHTMTSGNSLVYSGSLGIGSQTLCEVPSITTISSVSCAINTSVSGQSNNVGIELKAGVVSTTAPTPRYVSVPAYRLISVSSADTAGATTITLCSAAVCPNGLYSLRFTVIVTAACTGGAVMPSINYSDEVVNITPFKTVNLLSNPVAFTSTNSVSSSYVFQNQAAAPVNIATTGTACTSGGPGTGHMYMALERLQ